MTKIDIISGFLGAGKTTLIKKLLEENAFSKDRLVLIENEFGEIGIDGTLLKGYGIEIKEMNSGCICCTIAGDFSLALKEMVNRYQPNRIIIEPSGVGKLSDVIKGCRKFAADHPVLMNICMTVINGMKFEMYMENFAEFYSDQLINAKTIILSRTQFMKQEALDHVIEDIKKYNKSAPLILTDWALLKGTEIVSLAENSEHYLLENSILKEVRDTVKKGDRTYNRSGIKMSGGICKHQHADDVFTVWSRETARSFDYRRIEDALGKLESVDGLILRAKGILRTNQDKWIQFDYVPGEYRIKEIDADFSGRLCVIGENINDLELDKLFGV